VTSRRAALAAALLLGTACATSTPVGVERMDAREVDRDLTESALSTGHASAPTREFLTRLGLRGRFRDDPDAVLAALHAELPPEGDRDRVFALAELSFLHAERSGSREHALAAAVYAYAFLFPGDGSVPLDAFDPRPQIARNLYNRGLTRGFESTDDNVALEAGRHPLPFGSLDVSLAPGELAWGGFELEKFAPVSEFAVRGLLNRYRHAGLGAPLAASLGEPVPGEAPPGRGHIPPRLKIPVTAFLRLDAPRSRLAAGELSGSLELYSDEEGFETEVNGRSVPLELEKSSSLAYTLEGSPVYDFGFRGFRLGDYLPGGPPERLIFLHPYRPGKIPLVLVHGTFSSPATWAQLVNELDNYPEISSRYQTWLFLYNSGQPIAYSGGILVEALRDVIAELDPQGRDPALQRMVVAGHSQGGLVTKLTVVDSGDRFWRNATDRPFDSFGFDPDTRELLERSLFYERLPFVERVIFLSTPHHGSYLSDWSVTSLLSRLVKMPGRLTQLAVNVATEGQDALLLRRLQKPPTSLDNMRSTNPFLKTLVELPIASGVTAHSIVAVKGDGPVESGGDGVVRYSSAHIEGVESELVVRSGHSVQETPEGIREVRRILLEHAAAR
jgi:pimeloyl-ACP methyl ester carboxylesterase